ncbi:hypothetical protein C8J55DRAFT_560966 [Lentinula edodes]|uniref:Uncharacterized protein n=1 Tax=Lentinula lateritia TaxID=40482 RepID=A0A9W9AAU7_9AGAR|nr:hypothetical protein C8J55DRAFT_560966 [Lentinula edodes]
MDMVPILTKALHNAQSRVDVLEEQLELAKNLEKENERLVNEINRLQELVARQPQLAVKNELTDDTRLRDQSETINSLKDRCGQLEAELKKSNQERDLTLSEIATLQEKYKGKKKETRTKIVSLEATVSEVSKKMEKMVTQEQLPQAALARIHAHLQFLPRVSRHVVEGPKRARGLDILAYLKLAAPNVTNWFGNSYFYLPRRYTAQCDTDQHYLTCGPMNETIPGTNLQVQSTYQEAYGQTREMFTTVAGHVAYAGTYKCLDTKEFAPRGMVLPAGLPPGPIAHNASQSPHAMSKRGFPSHRELCILYEKGELHVEFTIFECVNYNNELAAALKQYQQGGGGSEKRVEWHKNSRESEKRQRGDLGSKDVGSFHSDQPSNSKRRKITTNSGSTERTVLVASSPKQDRKAICSDTTDSVGDTSDEE